MAGKMNVYNEMGRAQLENASADLSSPVLGLIYYNTTTNVAKLWNGTVWKAQNPLTTKGDIFTHSATDSSRLPVGTNGYVLTANSALPEGMGWNPVSVTNTILNTQVSYTILNNDGYRIVECNVQNASTLAVTLPNAASNGGRIITVKKIESVGSGKVNVAGTIDGDAGGFDLFNTYEYINVYSNGITWYVI